MPGCNASDLSRITPDYRPKTGGSLILNQTAPRESQSGFGLSPAAILAGASGHCPCPNDPKAMIFPLSS
ncbi:MAG: hypothetical protein P4L99_09290, partial [Chthoniobacter sp.]|nr:hypothetical protein [Chthoniobacter sp.]